MSFNYYYHIEVELSEKNLCKLVLHEIEKFWLQKALCQCYF